MSRLKWIFFALGLATELGLWAAKALADKKLTVKEMVEAVKIALSKFGVPSEIEVPASGTVKRVLSIIAAVGNWANSAIEDDKINIDEAAEIIEFGLISAGIPPEITWEDEE